MQILTWAVKRKFLQDTRCLSDKGTQQKGHKLSRGKKKKKQMYPLSEWKQWALREERRRRRSRRETADKSGALRREQRRK